MVLEVGPILKAIDLTGPASRRPPKAHKLFSKMEFMRGGENSQMQQLDEDDGPLADEAAQFESVPSCLGEEPRGGWLESDEIEDF
jgi:hypothetical protein